MENNQKDTASQNSTESRARHINYFADDDTDNTGEGMESTGTKQDADGGNDEFLNEISQIEIRIDPGNEHHHRTDADDKIFNEEIDRSPRFEADADGDGIGTPGSDQGQ